jgi:hypothetical protein
MRVAGWISASRTVVLRFSVPCDHPPLPHTATFLFLVLASQKKHRTEPARLPAYTPEFATVVTARAVAEGASDMSSRSSGSGGSSSGGAGATVPLSVLLRREVASERTAAERPELQTGLFCQAKKGEDFTFLKLECERVPGVPSSAFSAFGVSVPPLPFSGLSFPSRSRAPIWRHVDRWLAGVVVRSGDARSASMRKMWWVGGCGPIFRRGGGFPILLREMKGLVLECRPVLLSHWRTNAWRDGSRDPFPPWIVGVQRQCELGFGDAEERGRRRRSREVVVEPGLCGRWCAAAGALPLRGVTD